MTDHTATQPTAQTAVLPELTTAPRLRVAAITWGVFVIAVSSFVIWVVSDTGRFDEVSRWALGLTPGSAALIGVIVLGSILLLAGLLSALRASLRR